MTTLTKKCRQVWFILIIVQLRHFSGKKKKHKTKILGKWKKAFFFPLVFIFLFVRSFFRKRDICNFAEKIYLRLRFFYLRPKLLFVSLKFNSEFWGQRRQRTFSSKLDFLKILLKFFQIKIIMSQKRYSR